MEVWKYIFQVSGYIISEIAPFRILEYMAKRLVIAELSKILFYEQIFNFVKKIVNTDVNEYSAGRVICPAMPGLLRLISSCRTTK